MKWLSERPHTSGQRRDQDISNWIVTSFRNFGLDRVWTESFPATLSFPNFTEPNLVQVIDGNEVVATSAGGRRRGSAHQPGIGSNADSPGPGGERIYSEKPTQFPRLYKIYS